MPDFGGDADDGDAGEHGDEDGGHDANGDTDANRSVNSVVRERRVVESIARMDGCGGAYWFNALDGRTRWDEPPCMRKR